MKDETHTHKDNFSYSVISMSSEDIYVYKMWNRKYKQDMLIWCCF